ncbi:MAG TPA: DUF5703 domain-containing protein, partial [Verrucomicrobiae bacterium]|nr:DUF5703 domain-containing protein [Verrucomicrobiae bacterium]
RVRVQLTPNPFVGATNFTQVLKLEDGTIEIKSGANKLRFWVDVNHPVIHIQAKLAHPAVLQARLELWRTETHPYDQPSPDKGGLFEFGNHNVPIDFEADTVFPDQPNRIVWCHFNSASIYPLVFEQEHLESLLKKYPDALLHRCFGAALTGPGLTTVDDHTLKSAAARNFRLDLVALTETPAASPQAWHDNLSSLVNTMERMNLEGVWRAHWEWWNSFWNRSWIHVTGADDATEVSQGYIMQRYMMACSSRGALPVKFNGGLFAVGHEMPPDTDSADRNHNADYRRWGNSYWNQNNRLLYWPLVATGDFDLLKPWFAMYVDALPLAKDRTRIYFHHAGASLPETMLFWGLPNLNDFGWDNPTTELQSRWQRYHIQGTLEVIAQMLDEYDITQDADFARRDIVPFADAIVTYYGEHWPCGADGKIRMAPTQSLETYQLDAANPTPDIAGLDDVLPRLLALPRALNSPAQREHWTKILKELPAIPLCKTANGKLPRFGVGDPNGTTIILPAQKYGETRNVENPELYVAFPYRLFGVGKPGLKLARDTFAARLFQGKTCWGQDGTEAAILGLTREAQNVAISEFTDYGDQRFRWFWKAGGDWIPDLDDGGSGMVTLQMMLMQCDGKRIQLLPAWPANWTADFKLHAPLQTTVEGHVEDGKVTYLKVVPEARAKDVVIVPVNAP